MRAVPRNVQVTCKDEQTARLLQQRAVSGTLFVWSLPNTQLDGRTVTLELPELDREDVEGLKELPNIDNVVVV